MTMGARGGQRVAAFAVSVLLLGGAAVGFGMAKRAYSWHLQKLPIQPPGDRQLRTITDETERWVRHGDDEIVSLEILEELGTENYLTRWYVEKLPEGSTDRARAVQLHMAYYTGGIDTVPHVPERCFVGGGMQQSAEAQVVDIPLDTSTWLADRTVEDTWPVAAGRIYTTRLSGDHRHVGDGLSPNSRVRLPLDVTPDSPLRLRVSAFLMPGGGKQFAGYFFVANGGTVASAEGVRTLAFDLTSDYAYYLKVQFTSSSVESAEELAELAGGLLDGLLGEVMNCVPDWVEVQAGTYPEDNPRGRQDLRSAAG